MKLFRRRLPHGTVQGAAEGAGLMPRVREGVCKGVTGDALTNPSRHG